jgi:hypothetical protein
MTTVRFPMNSTQRIKNRRGKRGVSCMTTDRWLRFPEKAARGNFGDGKLSTAIVVDVMTDASGTPRKLCELCITLEDLKAVLRNIRITNERS